MPLSTPCPPWCNHAHLNDPDDLDPIHERGGAVLPGVARIVRRSGGSELTVAPEGCEVRPVLFFSAVRQDETWLALELGELGPGVTLTAETWRRVLPELTALLELV